MDNLCLKKVSYVPMSWQPKGAAVVQVKCYRLHQCELVKYAEASRLGLLEKMGNREEDCLST
jgi:hypothetical protein